MRTLKEIEQEIIIEKNQKPELQDLDATKPFSLIGAIIYVVAVAIFKLESIFNSFKEEVSKISYKTHNLEWYIEMAKKFQFGQSLSWDSDKGIAVYPHQNPQSQIIKEAAGTENQNTVLIKVAKGVAGNLRPLNLTELDSFKHYCNRFKDAGVSIRVISSQADSFQLFADIYIDELILNKKGELQSDNSIKPVELRVEKFIESLPFDSIVKLSSLVDEIQETEGVLDVVVRETKAGIGNNIVSFNRQYRSYAGYLKVDINHPLKNTLNYHVQNI